VPKSIYFRLSAAIAFFSLPLALRAKRTYQRLSCLPNNLPAGPLPPLTIIIPARNEEHNLRFLLPSLQAVDYPGKLEILVVDDNSTDRTTTIARAHNARVLQLKQGLPDGWLGKPHACHQGALVAGGEWLLFTDADTVHSPDGPARAVAYSLDNGLDGLSMFIHQECNIWSERLALTAAFAGLFAGHHSSNHLLNGQFILLRRQVYLDSGGFAAVRNQSLEDVALGNWLHKRGYSVPVIRGDDAASVHMYGSHSQVFQGMSKLGSDSLRWAGVYAIFTVSFITAVMCPWIVLVGVMSRKLKWVWLPGTWGAASLSILHWSRRFGSAWWALLAPIGALIVQVAGVYGLANRLLGRGVVWKDRRV
jgi:cellulose synthase/poly-beta-1,6-N-acetylglucosamine synthase-like glycosyltransferase